ncbi:Homeodomain-like superfamily protein [Abeliophyllum distichum]|uniref:Homeodomain-like superfamily protein n=1 Tax=Abeliophyllum distichum TaxID=126358 RepID=A0ABD1TEB1_9LAMI
MEEELYDGHSEDDKALPENNKKRKVKTRAQIEALEKLYNEHKYPTESIKLQLAESTGLTEKQISGWFCHRRLKDKRLLNEKTYAFGRQDRSSRGIPDHGSGHRQDSCGSTKQGDDRNSDTREVISGKLNVQDFSAAELTYERGSHYTGNYDPRDDSSSGSSSLVRNISSHHNGDPSDMATSRYLTPKFPVDAKHVKARSGPSGYLKVKDQVENTAITAVKRQLGRHYREDGPPLGIEFEPLPFGAFESSMQDPVTEPYYDGEPVLQASPDDSKIQKHPSFGKGYEYSSNTISHNSNVDRTSFKTRHGSDIPENNFQQKFGPKPNLLNHSDYCPEGFSEGFARDRPGCKSRDDYQMKPHEDSASCQHNLQPSGGNDYIEHKSSNLTIKGNEYHYYRDKGLSRRIIENGAVFGETRIVNDNCEPVRVKMPLKNEIRAAKRVRDEFYQQHVKRSSVLDNQPCTHHVIRSAVKKPTSFSEDDKSAETSSNGSQ